MSPRRAETLVRRHHDSPGPAKLVASGVRGLSVLPPWLQVLVAVASIGGTVLAALALYLRWRDHRPRLRIHTASERTPDDRASEFLFTVTNRNPVDMKISGFSIILTYPGKNDREVKPTMARTTRAPVLPYTLEARDTVQIFVSLEFIRDEATKTGHHPYLFVIPVVVDGLGARHEGRPWYLILDERPRREREDAPQEFPLSHMSVDLWRWKRRLANWRRIL